MIVKLLTEHHLEFLSLKEEAQTRLSLHLSKCQIFGNLMPRLIILIDHHFRLNSFQMTSELSVSRRQPT